MGDFNINLLNYENENKITEFLDGMCSNSFLPFITIPTRITPRSRTLIDNIFYNGTIQNTTAGNITGADLGYGKYGKSLRRILPSSLLNVTNLKPTF